MVEVFRLAEVVLDHQRRDAGPLVDLGPPDVAAFADDALAKCRGGLGGGKAHLVLRRAMGAHRQGERAARDRYRARIRQRPEHRPVAGRDGNAQRMALGHAVGDLVERDRHLDLLPRHQRLRHLEPVPEREVQHTPGHAGRGTVGLQVIEPHRKLRRLRRGLEPERQDRRADHVGFRKRPRIPDRRQGIIAPLVARQFRSEPDRAIFAAVRPAILRAVDQRWQGTTQVRAQLRSQRQRPFGDVGRGPGRLGDPAAGA